MTEKTASYYTDDIDATPGSGKLVLEIGEHEVACIVKANDSDTIVGFELFSIASEDKNWHEILPDLQSASSLLNKHYRETTCYYNCEEAMIIPAGKFNSVAADDYLSLAYGEKYSHDTRHDTIGEHLVNAYRIQKSMHELIGRHFVLYQPHHSFTALLNDVLETRHYLPGYFVKLQVYGKHCILCLLKDRKLQLIRSFRYRTQEDILYYLASLVQQFPVTRANAHLELSGMVPNEHGLFTKLFGEVSYEELPFTDKRLTGALADYPAYYFTPFFKLVV